MRMFDCHTCKQLENAVSFKIEDMAPWIDFACLHRMLIKHIISVLGCRSLDVFDSCVFKQTRDSGLLCAHYEQSRALNCFITILGIFDQANHRWLDHTSPPTSCGVGVFNDLSGDVLANPRTFPVRYNLTHQGDAMILRASRFKNQTVARRLGLMSTSTPSRSAL